MLVAVIAVSAVFAEFDKSKLNINVGQSLSGQYGVSYDFTDKIEAGVNVFTQWSVPYSVYMAVTEGDPQELINIVIPAGAAVFAEYKVAEFEHSDLKLGAEAGYYVIGPFLNANAVFSYHINENNSVFAKAVLPIPEVTNVVMNIYYGAIGYSYNF